MTQFDRIRLSFFFTFVTYSYVWRTPLDSLYGAQYHVVSIQLQSTRSRQIIGAVIREVRGNGKLTHHQPASPNCIHPLPVCLKICFDAGTSADTLMANCAHATMFYFLLYCKNSAVKATILAILSWFLSPLPRYYRHYSYRAVLCLLVNFIHRKTFDSNITGCAVAQALC